MNTTNFSSSIRLIRSARTIEVTKSFYNAASRYGTDAYEAMQKVIQDNPCFRVVVKKAPKVKADFYKGLTYDFMEKYITSHDDAEARMAMFNNLRAKGAEASEVGAEALYYGEIKAWFLKTYPEFAAFQKRREDALAA